MRRVIKKFLHQTQGAIAIEVALILPVLIAIIVTCLALYDGFRHYTMTTRASNVLADSISRIEAVLTPEDIEGLLNVFRYMTHQETGTSLRVSQFKRINDEVTLDWSYGAGDLAAMDGATAISARSRLPALPEGSHILLVETRFVYEPILNFDMPTRVFDNFMPTRPRFGDRVIFSLASGAQHCVSNCNISEGIGMEPIPAPEGEAPTLPQP
ncbi:hypothetical protein HKCCA1065_09365 [Rhodobacterales bacterium HKCCA1065]|nr:hypothetical protein [Rhodobacterales bacterium HKCCA1065]